MSATPSHPWKRARLFTDGGRVLPAVLVLLLAAARGLAAAPEVVVCPRSLDGPMQGPRTPRPDYQPIFADPAAWPEVFARTRTAKFYITSMASSIGLDLPRFVAMVRRGGFRAEFETGGLRPENAADFSDRSGEEQALKELRHLRNWVAAGGTVDAVTTDHAIMHHLSMNHRDKNYFTQKTVALPPGKEHLRFDRAALLDELMDYFLAVRAEFPAVRFGVIESLGYFHFTGRDGLAYPPTDARLPEWDFGEFLDALLETARRKGVEIDRFDIDFSYHGSCADTRRVKADRLDVGRTIAAVEACRARGLRVGIICLDDGLCGKDFKPRRDHAPAAERNRAGFENGLAYWKACRDAGIVPDRLVLQSWMDHPDKTGPESEPFTFFNTARELLRQTPP